MLIEPTGRYDDSDTGIGSYDLYGKDISDIIEKAKNDTFDKKLVEDFYSRNKEYEADCRKWIVIFKQMKLDYCIPKVGIFYFGGYTTTEDMKFSIYKIVLQCSRFVC